MSENSKELIESVVGVDQKQGFGPGCALASAAFWNPSAEDDEDSHLAMNPAVVGSRSVLLAVCPKCQDESFDELQCFCKKCGFYSKLGIQLDGIQNEDAEEKPTEPFDLLKAITNAPAWAWMTVGGAVILLTASISARFVTPDDSYARMIWGVSQLAIGFGIFAAAQFGAFVRSSFHQDRTELLDFVVRPLGVWGPTLAMLPKTKWHLASGVWGAFATLFAVAIVGGIPYDVLLDWGFEKPPEKTMVAAIVDATEQAEEKTLEEAIEEFSQQAGKNIPDHLKDKLKDKPVEPKATERVDCVVLGYFPTDESKRDFAELVIGATHQRKLIVVGRISSQGVPFDLRQEMIRKMRRIERETPLVSSPGVDGAVWLNPILACRVVCEGRLRNGALKNPEFDQALADIRN